MALFKINRGSEKNLPTGITDGYAYFCTDNQNFYIDFIDSNGVSTRKKLGVEFADKLRYLKDGAYIEIDPATLVVKTDLDNVAKLVDNLSSNLEKGAGDYSTQSKNTSSLSEPDDANTGVTVTAIEKPQANGAGSFAIGMGTAAEGDASVAEGINTTAGYVRTDGTRNVGSHAEGIHTFAKSSGSHAEGFYTESLASNSHTEGFQTKVNSDGWSGHAEGRETVVNNRAAHAEGYQTQANGTEGHAEGYGSVANGNHSHAEGKGTNAQGLASHAEGESSTSFGQGAHAEGSSDANGKYSHSEGRLTGAGGDYSHAEGDRANSTGLASHAEGVLTVAKYRSHAEGEGSTAGGDDGDSKSRAAHAEGLRTTATGTGSHSEGRDTKATAQAAHAEGAGTEASGVASHAGGTSTIAQWDNSTVIGKYNKTANLSNSSSNPLFIVGNGTGASNRSNALEVYADGTAYVNSKKILVDGDTSASIGNVTATATSVDSSASPNAAVTKNGNNLSFAFSIPKGEKGDPGSDYVLTDADKSEIAALVLAQIPDGDEVAYG